MLHLWSLATRHVDITHDAGQPEWIDAPITNYTIDSLSASEGHHFDGEKWTIRLPRDLRLMTAWYIDELCEQLLFTCIDPNGITLFRQLHDLEFREDIPRLSVHGLPLAHLWYTVTGVYAFTFNLCYDGLPYQRSGSFRLLLETSEVGYE